MWIQDIQCKNLEHKLYRSINSWKLRTNVIQFHHTIISKGYWYFQGKLDYKTNTSYCCSLHIIFDAYLGYIWYNCFLAWISFYWNQDWGYRKETRERERERKRRRASLMMVTQFIYKKRLLHYLDLSWSIWFISKTTTEDALSMYTKIWLYFYMLI